MAIVVDSSQWTGERDETPLAVPVVWGEFESGIARDNALSRLRAAGARDEGVELAPATVAPPVEAANQGQVPPPDEHPKGADQRNLRQNFVGIGMASTSMLAAGLVIATGGAALPAVAAAAAAGAATGLVGEAAGGAAAQAATGPEKAAPPQPSISGPVIGLQAPDQETREKAERLLRECGAVRIVVQETRAG